jgi:ferredoxin
MSDVPNDAAAAAAPAAVPVFEARIDGTGQRFPAPADRPLLQAAREAGLDLRSSCRNGACRACMCRVLSGTVRHRIEWPSLSPEEKVEGWVLPCVALPTSDVVLREAPFGRE